MLGKAGHHITVVHAPSVEIGEVDSDLTTVERGCRPEIVVPGRVLVEVVNGEDERVETFPGKAQRDEIDDGFSRDWSLLVRRVRNGKPVPEIGLSEGSVGRVVRVFGI
jgi:hypothetical protein